MQWQTYGYSPSALPDSNCFGGQQTEQQQAAAGGVSALAATPAGAMAAVQRSSFTGQLDAYSDKQVGGFVASHRGNGQPLVIDLSHIDFLDSSGLGALVQLAKQCNGDKQKFLVVGNARVVQTVKLVRLEEFLHLQPDLETALGNLAA